MGKKGITKLILSIFMLLAAGAIRPVFAQECADIKNGNCQLTTSNTKIPCSQNSKRCCASEEDCALDSNSGAAATQNANTTVASTLCDYIPDKTEKESCTNCILGTGNYVKQAGTWTAFGCISKDPVQFIQRFIQLATSIAGGIAFLLILFGGFQILTSAGNPEQLNAGRELISSAVAGLLLIIFSIFLLRVVGVNILGLPGFV